MRVPSVQRALAVLVGGVFLLAAVTKALATPTFAVAVDHLLRTGGGTALALAIAIIAWEGYLGARLLLPRPPRALLVATLGTLVVFTAALVILLADPLAPRCRCLGLLRMAASIKAEAAFGLGRNTVMIWIVGWLMVGARQDADSGGTPGPCDARMRASVGVSAARHAFTLVELLLVIAVIVLVVGLALPAIGRARDRAGVAASLSTHVQLLLALDMYATRNRDGYPFLGTPGDPTAPLRVGGIPISGSYFAGQTRDWTTLVVPDHYDTKRGIELPHQEEYLQVNRAPADLVRTKFWMTHTAFAAPAYWDADKPPTGSSYFRGTRTTEVGYPSNKGLLVDISVGFFDPRSPGKKPDVTVGRADGSAASILWRNYDPTIVVQRPFGAISWQVLSTRGGLAGRDF